MKKLLWGLGGLIALIALAIVIVPNVIDWNNYKPTISEQVRKLTGRDLIIAGDIEMKLLPAPSLTAERVALGSVEGAEVPDLAAVKTIEVRVALAPLLGGNVRIETVRLVEPVITLEVLADGRNSWTLTPTEAEPQMVDDGGPRPYPGGGAGGANVVLDSFEIVDGRVLYVDAATNTRETVEDVDLNVVAGDLLSGPYGADGSFVFRGLRLGVDMDVGEIVGGRTFPLELSLAVGGDSGRARLSGTVLSLDETPRFRGALDVASEDVGRVVAALADGAALPPALRQAMSLKGTVDASAESLAIADLALDFGGAKGTGSVSGQLNGTPSVTAELTVDTVNVDPWLKTASPGGDTVPAEEKTAQTRQTETVPGESGPGQSAGFALPGDVNATLAVRVGEVAMRGNAVRNVVMNAELAGGELTLSQFSLQAPGGTDLALFGFLTAKDGTPSFDGEVEVKVRDARTLMDWAAIEAPGLTADKPGALALKGAFQATPASVSIPNISLRVDDTNITGAATLALRERIGVGVNVNVDDLDLDAYLAPAARGDAPSGGDTASDDGGRGNGASPAAEGPFDALRPLTSFDANILAKVGRLKVSGVPIRGIAADIGLVAGDLTIREFTVADAASVAATASGALNGLDDTPTAQELVLKARIGDPAGLADMLGIGLPVPASNIGTPALSATLNGALTAPAVSATAEAFAATLNADGSVDVFNPSDLFDMALRLRHADTARLLRSLGIAYRPAGNIGALDVAMRLTGGAAAMSFTDLVAAIGPAKVNGEGTVLLSGPRPKIAATLNTGNITVDPFLPARRAASLDPRFRPDAEPARAIPARFDLGPDGAQGLRHLIATVSERWSAAPIDLSGLRAADLDLAVTSPRINYHEYRLDGAKLLAGLDDGLLKVNEFSGTTFGGSVMATASVDAAQPQPLLAGLVTVGNMDIGAASAAAGIKGTTGKLTSRIEVASAGNSVADWVRGLDGKGAIEVRGIKGQNSLADLPVIGLALGPLMQVFEILNTGLGALIGSGPQTKLGETDITSTFTIDNGTLTSDDTKILSNAYTGDIQGQVNLPLWSMNVGGNVSIAQGFLGTVIANVARVPSNIPFKITGDIDKPNVQIQSFKGSASQGGAGIPIPGLDKLEKKAPGVGGLIQGILGGGGSTSPPAPTAPPPQGDTGGTQPPPQQPAPQQQKTDPAQELLRRLLQ